MTLQDIKEQAQMLLVHAGKVSKDAVGLHHIVNKAADEQIDPSLVVTLREISHDLAEAFRNTRSAINKLEGIR